MILVDFEKFVSIIAGELVSELSLNDFLLARKPRFRACSLRRKEKEILGKERKGLERKGLERQVKELELNRIVKVKKSDRK